MQLINCNEISLLCVYQQPNLGMASFIYMTVHSLINLGLTYGLMINYYDFIMYVMFLFLFPIAKKNEIFGGQFSAPHKRRLFF